MISIRRQLICCFRLEPGGACCAYAKVPLVSSILYTSHDKSQIQWQKDPFKFIFGLISMIYTLFLLSGLLAVIFFKSSDPIFVFAWQKSRLYHACVEQIHRN